ncbi:high frequency lysogenization protein HflD [Kitasatospora sp. NPDC049285]|uniref:high frequency lysogenization protein HflD n=1 Tax=Kitasatospora sp. NPDC049285 TaxID=3157096 RepID=UPI00341E654C
MGLCLLLVGAPAADAHPLGNFSLNHYLGLTVRPDGIDALAVTDAAEIPTLQQQPQVDRDGNGAVDDAELAAWATGQCEQAARRLQVTAGQDTTPLAWHTGSARFRYEDGSGGLRTSRLECALHADLHLPAAGNAIRVASGNEAGRVGWNEITARGDGVTLADSDIPAASVSEELHAYPRDLLESPSGVTHARFRATPGGAPAATGSAAVRAGSGPTAWLGGLDARLARLGATERLTVPLGLLAVLLSVVLGAGHALLPGHGKTVMAAYLAGRRGRTRDAVTVGATVTVTHTAGVIVIGLCLTTFSSLAGDVLLGWLGVVSGALVALVGAGLLRDAVHRSRHARSHTRLPHPQPGPDSTEARELAHTAAHSAGTPHDHDPHPEPDGDRTSPGAHHGHTRTAVADHDHPHHHDDHDHPHHNDDHDHPHHNDDHDHHDHDHPNDHGHGRSHAHGHPHVHGHVGDLAHSHHGHRHGLFGGHHQHDPAPTGRRNLIGLGIAGGLVPSPSALVVLLGAVALGRTLFGAALVVAYGVGMAATLTAVGLLLVRVGDRLASVRSPISARIHRIAPYSALLTAALILTVGLGLVIRSLPATL